MSSRRKTKYELERELCRLAQVEANAWCHPLGTPVVVAREGGERVTTCTRSKPWVNSRGVAVLLVAGLRDECTLRNVELAPKTNVAATRLAVAARPFILEDAERRAAELANNVVQALELELDLPRAERTSALELAAEAIDQRTKHFGLLVSDRGELARALAEAWEHADIELRRAG